MIIKQRKNNLIDSHKSSQNLPQRCKMNSSALFNSHIFLSINQHKIKDDEFDKSQLTYEEFQKQQLIEMIKNQQSQIVWLFSMIDEYKNKIQQFYKYEEIIKKIQQDKKEIEQNYKPNRENAENSEISRERSQNKLLNKSNSEQSAHNNKLSKMHINNTLTMTIYTEQCKKIAENDLRVQNLDRIKSKGKVKVELFKSGLTNFTQQLRKKSPIQQLIINKINQTSQIIQTHKRSRSKSNDKIFRFSESNQNLKNRKDESNQSLNEKSYCPCSNKTYSSSNFYAQLTPIKKPFGQINKNNQNTFSRFTSNVIMTKPSNKQFKNRYQKVPSVDNLRTLKNCYMLLCKK